MDNDTISRQAAISFIENVPYIKSHQNMGDLIKVWLEQIPAVQPEQKIGRWINDKHNIPRCSCCSYIPEYSVHINDYYYSDYCPNCGAFMPDGLKNVLG